MGHAGRELDNVDFISNENKIKNKKNLRLDHR